MDTVFRVYDTFKTEVYLLDDWVAAEDGKIYKWFQTFTTTEGGDINGHLLPVCNFDCSNLAWSENSVLASITLDL